MGSLSLPRAVESVAGTEGRAAGPAITPREDFRVRCTSKQAVLELMELCGRFVRQLGDALPAEVREPALRDAQWVRAQTPALVSPSSYPVAGLRQR